MGLPGCVALAEPLAHAVPWLKAAMAITSSRRAFLVRPYQFHRRFGLRFGLRRHNRRYLVNFGLIHTAPLRRLVLSATNRG
ncbi:hypothetical protein LuPra_03370 [Luteitalea pratensis]|uniref:Uncharacterized protein n=1 Tax=Luteitalea pratensis TaxID=1855912 RepID=A0A143PNF8_LUTPR|nr:hypothetical protein LuPra_03370 [Luteitalea pratensis]